MINILGYEYEVNLSQTEKQIGGQLGNLDGKYLLIDIASDMNPQQILSTLLHEIIEAINFHSQLNLPHESISLLEAGLFQILTANGVDLAPLLEVEHETS